LKLLQELLTPCGNLCQVGDVCDVHLSDASLLCFCELHEILHSRVGQVSDMLRKEKKEKTTPFGVNLLRSQVLYRAAQGDMVTMTAQAAAATSALH